MTNNNIKLNIYSVFIMQFYFLLKMDTVMSNHKNTYFLT